MTRLTMIALSVGLLYIQIGASSPNSNRCLVGKSTMVEQISHHAGNEAVPQDDLYSVPPGDWGAAGVKVVVAKDSVNFDFDCAEGAVSQKLRIDRQGNFKVDGTYKHLAHGHIRVNLHSAEQPARYEGKISGTSMVFKIILTKTKELVGEFTVELGKDAKITKCR